MNFGLIGLGHIANKFADTLNKMGKTLYAVASSNIDKAKAFKEKYNSITYYGSYMDLYKDPKVDIIYIATPNSLHYKNAYDALMHNKNVICEKPFTTNPSEAKELYDLAKSKNLFIMEALWPEFFPSTKKLKELIKNNTIGDIKHIGVTYGSYKDYEVKKRLCDSSLGGGALLDIGIYPLSFIDMILDCKVKSFTSDVKINEYHTDEYSKIHLEYENGASADVLITFNEELKKEAYIEGTKGMIYVPNHHQNEGFIVKLDKDIEYSYPFKINGFEYQIEEAISSIQNHLNESMIYPGDKSIRLMELLYDIRMSWNMKYSYEV